MKHSTTVSTAPTKKSLVLALLVLCLVLGLPQSPASAKSAPSVSVGPLPTTPAFDGYPCSGTSDTTCPVWNSCKKLHSCTGDAPDPSVVKDGADYWAFSTGTALGNGLQVLKSSTLQSGYHPLTPLSSGGFERWGSTPFLNGTGQPSWAKTNSETSPDVVNINGTWMLYFDARSNQTNKFCLGVAIGPKVSTDPTTHTQPYFTSASQSPLLCTDPAPSPQDGVIDPTVYVDPSKTAPTLIFKCNDGSSKAPAYIDAIALTAKGLSTKGAATQLITNDTVNHPWEQTVENPSLLPAAGEYALIFSGGRWDTGSYAEGVAWCKTPRGPCTQNAAAPFLVSYGSVAGPGGGSVYTDATEKHWLVYAGWTSSCVGYNAPDCSPARHLFLAPLTITP